jgi:tRNA nucleotidyltransferase (CCA-adding enzyme)
MLEPGFATLAPLPSLADLSTLPASLRALPAAAALLGALDGEPGVHLVGGAVRDLLLGREPRELDVVVEGDAGALARRLDPAAVVHDRFGTATAVLGGHVVDLATARRERYPTSGALPEVEPAGLEEDLRRRDVTVNAIALPLAGGPLAAVPRAVEDLACGVLRVLHDASFVDDPTRLHRMARYAARLGFEVERHTRALAAAAVAGGALATVSGPRIGSELRLAAGEPDALAALSCMAELGLVPAAAHPLSVFADALALLPHDGRADLLVLGAWQVGRFAALGFSASELTVLDRLVRAKELAVDACSAGRPSALRTLLDVEPVEAVALAGALGAREPVRTYLDVLRHVRLSITGADLLAAGVPEGPEVGRRLRAALAARVDGEASAGRDDELGAALSA